MFDPRNLDLHINRLVKRQRNKTTYLSIAFLSICRFWELSRNLLYRMSRQQASRHVCGETLRENFKQSVEPFCSDLLLVSAQKRIYIYIPVAKFLSRWPFTPWNPWQTGHGLVVLEEEAELQSVAGLAEFQLIAVLQQMPGRQLVARARI